MSAARVSDGVIRVPSDAILIVEIREPYGVRTIYPVNEIARRFAELLEQKTLTVRDIERIKKLGFVVETKKEEL